MDFLINAEKREKKGTSSSRNIRRDGFVPGIIYGAGKEEQTISLRKHEVAKNLEQDAFYSQVLDISLDGKKSKLFFETFKDILLKERFFIWISKELKPIKKLM